MRKTLIVTALLLGFGINASAAEIPAMPKDLPAYAADKPLPVPQISKRTLPNGLEIWVARRDAIPRVDYVLAFRNAGLAADEANAPGFASILAGLLTEGSAKRDSRAIAETAQGYGGGLGAFAGTDGIVLNADALTSNAVPMLHLLAEVARSPSFPAAEVELAKTNALQGLKAAEAQPGFRAERALAAAMYGDHPYARTQATEEAIKSITRAQLVAAHQQRLRPDQALLVITGRIEAEAAFAAAEKAFADWKTEGKPRAALAPARGAAEPSFQHLARANSVQSALRVGRPAIPATHADHIALRVASTILGGGFSSRLNQNLREDKGYTYGAGLGHRALQAGGALVTNADVRTDVTAAALREVLGEYQRIGEQAVSAEELQMNQRYIAGGYLINNQLQGAVAGTLANNWLVGLPPEYLGEFVPKVRAVDAAAVQAAAKKYLSPKSQSIIVVGDPAALESLAEFGKFEAKP